MDSEAALTRSQQRFFSATYTYLASLAGLDYALGQPQDTFSRQTRRTPRTGQKSVPEELPVPPNPATIQ